MHKLLVFLLFLFSLNASAAGSMANDRARGDERIINGREVREGDAEWTVSIRNSRGHFCGGSLVSPVLNNSRDGSLVINGWKPDDDKPRWVVTAAHCFVDNNGNVVDTSEFRVLSGVLSLENSHEGELHTIEKVFAHHEYDRLTLVNDIAILKISSPIKDLSISKRSSIRLPKISDGLWLNQPYVSLFTAGWGRTEHGFASARLLEAQIPRVAHDFCQEKFAPYGKTIHSGMTCAGFTSGEYDSCQGDSGGPLFYRPADRSQVISRTTESVLTGVVSWGIGCGTAELFGVYTNVSVYKDWIELTVLKFHEEA